jgi:hypothetical protein
MSNTNYNTKNKIYTENEKNFNNFDISISTLDLIVDKIADNQPLKIWRQKSLPKTNKKAEYVVDLWKKELNRNLETNKAKKLPIAIDSYIQYCFSNKVRPHQITAKIREIKNSNQKELAKKIKSKINHTNQSISIKTIIEPHDETLSVDRENQTLSISRNFTFQFFKNFGLSLHVSEIALINHLILIEVQNCKFKNEEATSNNNYNPSVSIKTIIEPHDETCSNEPESYSKGYIINRNFIKFWDKLEQGQGQIENKVSQTYDVIKSVLNKGGLVYSFNRDENFELDFGSGRRIQINSLRLNDENCGQLETGDLVFNQIDASVFDIEKIKARLLKKQNRLVDDVLKNKRSFGKAKNLDLQIDSLLSMFDFMSENGYWIDLYRVGQNGRLYAQGIAFQNISKELREIIFPKSKFENRDQTAAHPTIIYDLSEDCVEKEILGDYLSNKEEYHQLIKEECGLGKKAIKKRRSCATQGYVFEKDKIKNSVVGYGLMVAIQTLYLKLDPKAIIKEEMKRTFGLIGNSTMIVWLHDGAIVRK